MSNSGRVMHCQSRYRPHCGLEMQLMTAPDRTRTLLLTDFHPAAIAWRWRTEFMEPGSRYLLPNSGHSRNDYLSALTAGDCTLLDVQDIALDGKAFGDVSAAAVQKRGEPPLCLTLFARRNLSNGRADAGASVGKDAK